MATVVLVHSADVPVDEVTSRVQGALVARELIEQGVLSELHGLDMEQAAVRLEEMAASRGPTGPEVARRIIGQASGVRH